MYTRVHSTARSLTIIVLGIQLAVTGGWATCAAARSRPVGKSIPFAVSDLWSGEGGCLATAGDLDERIASFFAARSNMQAKPARTGAIAHRPSRAVASAEKETGAAHDVEPLVCRAPACRPNPGTGDALSARLRYGRLRYGYDIVVRPGSGRDATPPTSEELEDMLLALEDMRMLNADFDTRRSRTLAIDARARQVAISKMDASYRITALSSDDPRIGIRMQPSWRTMARPARRATTFHELAHDWFRRHTASGARRTWARAAATDDLFQANTGRDQASVSTYAATDLDEDFAESATAHRYAPHLLAGHTPNRARLLEIWFPRAVGPAQPDPRATAGTLPSAPDRDARSCSLSGSYAAK